MFIPHTAVKQEVTITPIDNMMKITLKPQMYINIYENARKTSIPLFI